MNDGKTSSGRNQEIREQIKQQYKMNMSSGAGIFGPMSGAHAHGLGIPDDDDEEDAHADGDHVVKVKESKIPI